MNLKLFLNLLLTLTLVSCSSIPSSSSRYKHRKDFEPNPKSIAHLQEPIPRYEPRSRGGNAAQYTVWGKTYRVMSSAEGFTQTGLASWYGMKFHGHKTANGETYDVYKFSAAHKNLPLPSFARVTRLDTNKSIIVRVNDRGPFHGNRIIDLSYAAAVRLGIHKQGTARVKVEAITPSKSYTPKPRTNTRPQPVAAPKPSAAHINQKWIQVGAYRNINAAFKLKKAWQTRIAPHTYPVQVYESKSHLGLYRVHIGPIAGNRLNTFLQYLRQKHHVRHPVVLTRDKLTR